MKIAISGPAAAGKGTISRRLAMEANMGYVDLGLLFRLGTFALYMGKVNSILLIPALIRNKEIQYIWINGKVSVVWRGEDITHQLLNEDIAEKTSILASEQMRQDELTSIAECVLETFENVVCDGRNAGTTILPKADFKFFITASVEERARRRYADLLRLDEKVSYPEVLRDINERDQRDSERPINPLMIPRGAITLETDTRSVEESVHILLKIISGN